MCLCGICYPSHHFLTESRIWGCFAEGQSPICCAGTMYWVKKMPLCYLLILYWIATLRASRHPRTWFGESRKPFGRLKDTWISRPLGERAQGGEYSCQTPRLLFRSHSERKKHWKGISGPWSTTTQAHKLLRRIVGQSGSAGVVVSWKRHTG